MAAKHVCFARRSQAPCRGGGGTPYDTRDLPRFGGGGGKGDRHGPDRQPVPRRHGAALHRRRRRRQERPRRGRDVRETTAVTAGALDGIPSPRGVRGGEG